MRIHRTSTFKAVALIAVLAFLFGVSSVWAGERVVDRDVKPVSKKFFKSVHVGKQEHGLDSFLKTLAGSECTSSCCWATADCAGGDTECSSSRCDAWCPDGSHAGYSCTASAI